MRATSSFSRLLSLMKPLLFLNGVRPHRFYQRKVGARRNFGEPGALAPGWDVQNPGADAPGSPNSVGAPAAPGQLDRFVRQGYAYHYGPRRAIQRAREQWHR